MATGAQGYISWRACAAQKATATPNLHLTEDRKWFLSISKAKERHSVITHFFHAELLKKKKKGTPLDYMSKFYMTGLTLSRLLCA